MMNGKDQRKIQIVWQDPAMVQIGKGGVSDNVVEEVKRLLKRHQYIKVRVLRSAIGDKDKIEIITLLSQKTGARIDGFRGNTAVIYKTRHLHTAKQ
ncbi:MAG: YhbY family RNA-binding protein [Candidatus Thorarchaeota archaeon]